MQNFASNTDQSKIRRNIHLLLTNVVLLIDAYCDDLGDFSESDLRNILESSSPGQPVGEQAFAGGYNGQGLFEPKAILPATLQSDERITDDGGGASSGRTRDKARPPARLRRSVANGGTTRVFGSTGR